MADRRIIADFAFTGNGSTPPYYECIAVSQTSDLVAGGWYFYAFRADDAAYPWFPDYPKMGIWPDGLYMTANMFNGNTFNEVRLGLQSGRPRVRRAASLGGGRPGHDHLLQPAAQQPARGRAAGRAG